MRLIEATASANGYQASFVAASLVSSQITTFIMARTTLDSRSFLVTVQHGCFGSRRLAGPTVAILMRRSPWRLP
jgi:hypothetical protein